MWVTNHASSVSKHIPSPDPQVPKSESCSLATEKTIMLRTWEDPFAQLPHTVASTYPSKSRLTFNYIVIGQHGYLAVNQNSAENTYQKTEAMIKCKTDANRQSHSNLFLALFRIPT